MKTDVELLQESYDKYNDKSGKKARNLKDKIETYKAFSNLVRKVFNEGICSESSAAE